MENALRHGLAAMESGGAYSTWGESTCNTPQLCTLQANKRHTGSLQGQCCILIQRLLGLHTAQHTDWGKICFGSSAAGLLCLFSQLGKSYFYVIYFCLHCSNVSGFQMALAWWSCFSCRENMLWKLQPAGKLWHWRFSLCLYYYFNCPSLRNQENTWDKISHTKLSKSFATDCSVAGFHSESQFLLPSLLIRGKAVNEHYILNKSWFLMS